MHCTCTVRLSHTTTPFGLDTIRTKTLCSIPQLSTCPPFKPTSCLWVTSGVDRSALVLGGSRSACRRGRRQSLALGLPSPAMPLDDTGSRLKRMKAPPEPCGLTQTALHGVGNRTGTRLGGANAHTGPCSCWAPMGCTEEKMRSVYVSKYLQVVRCSRPLAWIAHAWIGMTKASFKSDGAGF